MEKFDGSPKCQWEDNVEMNHTNRLQRCELDWLRTESVGRLL